jgi:hypothetical protein
MMPGKMNSNKWIYVIAAAFFIKAMILAFWIVPLWDLPDETGHFSYARDMATGMGIPVLGKSLIGADIIRNKEKQFVDKDYNNYIAQHPPASYVIAGTLWKIATFFTSDEEILFRAPRIASALSGALTLVVIYFILMAVSGNRPASLAFSACVGFIPMFSHLSSITSNDIPLMLFSALATLSWVKFMLHKGMKNAYLTAFWLSMACITKLTALVFVAPMLAIMLIGFDMPWKSRIKQAAGVLATAAFLPGLWMIRCHHLYGRFLATNANVVGEFRFQDHPISYDFISYLRFQPAIENLFNQFFGLFGVTGTEVGSIRLLKISSFPLTIYAILLTILLLVASVYLVLGIKKIEKIEKAVKILWMVAAAIISLFTLFVYSDSFFFKIVFALLSFIWVISFYYLVNAVSPENRLITFGWMIFGFFMIVFLNQIYHFFLMDGRVRAAQGRYLYPLIPLMMIGVFIPVLVLLKKYGTHLFFLIALIMGYLELHVYFSEVIPFFMTGK